VIAPGEVGSGWHAAPGPATQRKASTVNVVRLAQAKKYDPPKHVGCHAMYLQHKTTGSQAPYWMGCSYYLPGGTAELDASDLHKVYVVLDGEITVSVEGAEERLGPMDSVYLAPGESRAVTNHTNRVATMLVIMPYPPGQPV
jgi:mannose-6-phosphate isomerase-like protein (cupin superfamily)